MNDADRAELFGQRPIKSAVNALVLPAVISQMINVAYNLADVFFIGQMGDPDKVAAISLAMPLFMVLTAVGNLFGIGGSSAISRAMGAGDHQRAAKHAAFCFYTALGCAALYGALVLVFLGPVLHCIGASAATLPHAKDYARWVIGVGAAPTVMSATLAHLLRADGASKESGIGLSMGGLMNILLDALLVLGCNLGVLGAALATLASNLLSCGFFLLLWRARRRGSSIQLSPRLYRPCRDTAGPVFSAGVPAAAQTLVVSLMYMAINHLAAAYGDVTVAALGVVQKLDMIPQYVTLGISQGIIPLLGYSYAAGQYGRMTGALRYARRVAVGFSLVCLAAFEGLAPKLVWCFIQDLATVGKGVAFLRIICICCPFMAFCNTTNALFQATGRTAQALHIALFRRFYAGIPLLYLLNFLFGEVGIAWTQPVADALATFLALFLYRRYIGGLREQPAAPFPYVRFH